MADDADDLSHESMDGSYRDDHMNDSSESPVDDQEAKRRRN